MPKVGTKRFAYTEKGEKAAKGYAKKTGQPVKITKPAKRMARGR